MALNFNPYPLEPWLRRQEQEQPPDFNQTVTNPIMQGLQMMAEKRQQDRQNAILEIQAQRQNQQHQFEYGRPSPSIPATGLQIRDTIGPGMGMDPSFGRKPMFQARSAPQPMFAPPARQELPDVSTPQNVMEAMRQGWGSQYIDRALKVRELDRKTVEDNAAINLKNAQADYYSRRPTETTSSPSLDQLLAQMVRSGEMSIQEAMGLKRNKESGGGGVDLALEIPGYEQTGEVKVGKDEAERLRKGTSAYNAFRQRLTEYRGLIEREGTTSIDPKIRAEMEAYAKRLQLDVKNLAQLGVLSASDIPFIEQQIRGPGIFQTERGMKGSLDTSLNMADRSQDAEMGTRGYRRKSNSLNPDQEMKSIGGKTYVKINGEWFEQ